MSCAICGARCAVLEHHRYTGLTPETWRRLHPGKPWSPARVWRIEAPLYFAPTQDHTGIIAAFCGPAHALAWFEQRRA